jgi:hypothetical protein
MRVNTNYFYTHQLYHKDIFQPNAFQPHRVIISGVMAEKYLCDKADVCVKQLVFTIIIIKKLLHSMKGIRIQIKYFLVRHKIRIPVHTILYLALIFGQLVRSST